MRQNLHITRWPAGMLLAGLAMAHGATTPGDHDRYRWRDSQGTMFYADTIPTEALKYGYDIISPQGLVRKHVERVFTPEERAAGEMARKVAQGEQDAEQARQQRDLQLLAGYPEEADLARAHAEALEHMDQQVRVFEGSLAGQERALAEALANAARNETGAKHVTDGQRKDVAELQRSVAEQLETRNRLLAERKDLAARLGAEMTHYRELKARRASGAMAAKE